MDAGTGRRTGRPSLGSTLTASASTTSTARSLRTAGRRCTPTRTRPAGEVYVIAVDPKYHGRGLGRALTLAGYEHLTDVGLTRGMLYVDADNTPAVTLYRNLGLDVAVIRRLFIGVGSTSSRTTGRQ